MFKTKIKTKKKKNKLEIEDEEEKIITKNDDKKKIDEEGTFLIVYSYNLLSQ